MLYGNKQNGETTAYRIDKITGTIDTSFVQIFCNYGNDIKSNMYAAKNRFGVNLESNVFNIRFLTEKYPNVNSVKKRIQEYPVILYYPLGTIIEEQITDTNLISQLNTILNYLISLELKGQEYILTLEDYIYTYN